MIERYAEACSEVAYIIDNMSVANREKIPTNFIEHINKSKSNEYVVSNQISLDNPVGLKKETKAILSVMYRDFFCREEERAKLKKADEEALESKYSYENLFKGREKQKRSNNIVKAENDAVKDYEALVKVDKKTTGIFGKIRNFIKGIFRR